ncbi:helix-turn-helix domain-containing protein [Streptomyces sp. Da 82-17]|uniref:helix-turn-helix domain-containing protein n=1 Tax=Streptomyces sp. Da 82-17 TaxID=3377116 RepID=UPI0038D4125D
MSRPIPEHGNPNRYAYGCRCAPCTRAASRADALRRLDRMAGRPRQIPAGQAADHVRALLGRGLTVTQIGRESGLQPSTIRRLVNGQTTILAVNAAKVLAVPLDVRPSLGDVPAVGAIRRVRALYALGHLNHVIAAEAGISRDAVCHLAAGDWATLKVGADDGVRAAYDRLSMTTGTSWKTRRLAERKGWAPPLAWDDDSIDDPDALPQTDAVRPVVSEGERLVERWLMGESVILGADERREALVHLFEWTALSAQEIGARLDMSGMAASRAWERHKARARSEGRPVPWRRRSALRSKELTKYEMEEAA